MSSQLVRRLHRVLRLLERFEPRREDGDTLWDGPFFIPRSGDWWPTSFLRYQNRLFCAVDIGWSRQRLTWVVGTKKVQFEETSSSDFMADDDEALWTRVLDQVEERLIRAADDEGAFNARVARQMAIALSAADVPFELSHRDEVLAALRGEDLIDVGPFYRQLSLEELEHAHPGAQRHVVWSETPQLRMRKTARTRAPATAARREQQR